MSIHSEAFAAEIAHYKSMSADEKFSVSSMLYDTAWPETEIQKEVRTIFRTYREEDLEAILRGTRKLQRPRD